MCNYNTFVANSGYIFIALRNFYSASVGLCARVWVCCARAYMYLNTIGQMHKILKFYIIFNSVRKRVSSAIIA